MLLQNLRVAVLEPIPAGNNRRRRIAGPRARIVAPTPKRYASYSDSPPGYNDSRQILTRRNLQASPRA